MANVVSRFSTKSIVGKFNEGGLVLVADNHEIEFSLTGGHHAGPRLPEDSPLIKTLSNFHSKESFRALPA
jgi:hypothetical protein